MAGYGNVPRRIPYGFLGYHPRPTLAFRSHDGTGPASFYFRDGNGESYSMTGETTIQCVPPSAFIARSYEFSPDWGQMPLSPTRNMLDVEEYLKKIQTEVSQPSGPPAVFQSPFGFPHPTPAVQFGPTTRVDFGEFTNVMPRPITELGFIGRGRVIDAPIRTASAQPRSYWEISKAVNDISEATEYLKEFARPPAPNTDTVTAPQNLASSS